MSTPLDSSQSSTLAGGPSFSLANRMARVLWGVSWLLLARWTPPPCHRWRRFVLKRFGARIAPGARVHASVRIWLPANLSIGEDSLIGPGAHLYNQGHIAIGSGTVISQGAYICASSHDVRDPKFQLVLKPVRIGDGCWVAADAFVGPGVHIGDGAVLAARGALFSDAQAGGIYRGNPAAFVRARELREGS